MKLYSCTRDYQGPTKMVGGQILEEKVEEFESKLNYDQVSSIDTYGLENHLGKSYSKYK